MRNLRINILLHFLILFLAHSLLTAQQPQVTAAMIADIRAAREVQLSPDGQHIAWTLRIPGGEDDPPGSRWTELLVMDFDGKNRRTFVGKPHSTYNIRWAPDGESIYFLARRKESDPHTQIYQIAVKGGEAVQISRNEENISAFELAPDGKSLAFTAKEGLSAKQKQDHAQGKDWIVYDQDHRYRRLQVFDLQTGKSQGLFTEDLEVSEFVWTPDGQKVVFKAASTPETDAGYMFQKIYQVRREGGNPTVVCKTEGKLGPIEVSPDGTTLAWCGAVDISDPLPQSLFTAPLDGSSPPRRHSLGREASAASFSWLSKDEILLLLDEGVYTNLYRLSTSSGKMQTVLQNGPILLHFSQQNGKLATIGSTPEHPGEVFAGTLADKGLNRLTFSNPDLAFARLGKQEVMDWKGPGGLRIEGILTYPVGYQPGKKYPLLLQIHGGPEGVSQQGWNTSAVYPVQLYATHGFFVLQPNYRGSRGRGVDFAKADHQDLGGKEFEDVLAGIDALAEKGLIDPEKVGTGGFSYGGYFSAWAATRHSDRFKAAMVGAGITNWISFTGTTDIIQENSLVHWNLWWYDEMKLVWDRSPLAHIKNAKTPTLIVHGENDLRVPPGQGIELYQALKLRDVPTSLVIYKRQGHGIGEWSAQVDYMNRSLAWFTTHIR